MSIFKSFEVLRRVDWSVITDMLMDRGVYIFEPFEVLCRVDW